MAQYELKELEGKIHRSEDVESIIEDLAINIRQVLLALPTRVSVEVINSKSRKEATNIIANEVNLVLMQLSNYEYNPQFYKDKARNRKGWSLTDEDNIE